LDLISIARGNPQAKKTPLKEERNTRKVPGGPERVRLRGFITDEEIGLGDAIKRVTYSLGIQPCAGCERRAAALNRWLVFTRRGR
jgi:hypothetical protein